MPLDDRTGFGGWVDDLLDDEPVDEPGAPRDEVRPTDGAP